MIDKYLNKYANKTLRDEYDKSNKVEWWWNGDQVIAAAISSLARHVRKDGCHALGDADLAELKRLEKYFAAYAADEVEVTPEQADWLYAESMFLLQKWFTRLWD